MFAEGCGGLQRVVECFLVSVWFELSLGMESTGWLEQYGVRQGACCCILEACFFGSFLGFGWLGEEDIDVTIGVVLVVKFDAKEMFNWAFKVNIEVGFGVDEGFELRFYFIAFTEVDEVIDVEHDVDGRLA